jgi:hypothetical protein
MCIFQIFPQISEHWHFLSRYVFGDRNAWQLDDAAFDGIHQREVAHRPRKQGALGIAGAAQEEWCRRQVDDAAEAELAVYSLQAGNPQPRRLVGLLGFFLFLAFEFFVVGFLRLLAVAVVRLIIDDENVLHAHQVRHDPLNHLAFGFERIQFLADTTLQELPTALGQIEALARLEGVEVRDDDLRPVHIIEHVVRNDLAAGVVAVGIVGLQDAQPVLDRQAWCAHEESAGKMLASLAPRSVDGLPRDQHSHYGGLACACSELERKSHQFGIGVLVRGGEMIKHTLASARLRGNLGEPDRSFRRLDLAEEGALAAELVLTPVL